MIVVLDSCCTEQNRSLCIYCFYVYYVYYVYYTYRARCTLNCFATQSAGLFPQSMYHHALLYSRALIGFASLLFYPILVGKFSNFHIHVVSISPAGDVLWRMINAVHLLSIANQIIKLVFVWKELRTSANEPVEDKLIKYNRLCNLYILCIIYNLCILHNDLLFAKCMHVASKNPSGFQSER